MMNKLSGQPDSYDKKYASLPTEFHTQTHEDHRAQYRFGRTLGAGTYGIVREAECNGERYAIKIILKKNVKGNEKMVYDEMVLLQRMRHKNIVRFHDWFESKVRLTAKTDANLRLTVRSRTNTTSLRNWPRAANYSIGYASTASSRRRMRQGRSRRYSKP